MNNEDYATALASVLLIAVIATAIAGHIVHYRETKGMSREQRKKYDDEYEEYRLDNPW